MKCPLSEVSVHVGLHAQIHCGHLSGSNYIFSFVIVESISVVPVVHNTLYVDATKPFSISCTAAYPGELTVWDYRGNGTGEFIFESEATDILTFDGLRPSDSGDYICFSRMEETDLAVYPIVVRPGASTLHMPANHKGLKSRVK